jgi:hypothetical protein
LKNYREIEDEHAALHLGLIKLQGLLLRIEDAVQEDSGTGEMRSDLWEIEAELNGPTNNSSKGATHAG